MGPSPMCGEAGLHTTALANLAARAEADEIIPFAGFCVNVQLLTRSIVEFCSFLLLDMENPRAPCCQNQAGEGLSRQIVWGEAWIFRPIT
jgi:hypothetical protein